MQIKHLLLSYKRHKILMGILAITIVLETRNRIRVSYRNNLITQVNPIQALLDANDKNNGFYM